MSGKKESFRFQLSAVEERKKNLTRAKLMDAAINVIAQKGVEKASILEVTKSAGLANGTFYLYFKNKNELIDAVGLSIIGAIVDAIHNPVLADNDPAIQVANHLCAFVQHSAAEPQWMRMIVDSMQTTIEHRNFFEYGIREDIRQGIASGRFDVEESEEILSILAALCRTGVERLLDGAAIEPVQIAMMEAALRILGVDHKEARNIANYTRSLVIWEDLRRPQI